MFKKLTTVILSIALVASSADITALAAEITVQSEGAQITDTDRVSGIGVSDPLESQEVLVEEIITEDSISDDIQAAGTVDTLLTDNSVSSDQTAMISGDTSEEVLSEDNVSEVTGYDSGLYSEAVDDQYSDFYVSDDDWDFTEQYEFEEEEEEEDEYRFEDDYVDNGSWKYIYVLPKLTGDKRADAAAIAYSQIGYHEGRNNKNAYGPQAAWCVYFARWCARKAGLTSSEWGDTGNTIVLSDWFRSRDRFHDKVTYEWSRNGFTGGGAKDDYVPQPGDFVAIESHGNKDNGPDHTGIVYSVKGDQMITVEGNLNNQVGLVVYSLRAGRSIKKYINGRWHFVNTEYIVGFGEPDYGENEDVISEIKETDVEKVKNPSSVKKIGKSKSNNNVVEEEREDRDDKETKSVRSGTKDRATSISLRKAVVTGVPEDGIPEVNGEILIEEMIRSGEIVVTADDGTVLEPFDASDGEGDYEIYYKVKSRGRKISVVFVGTGKCGGTLRKTFKIAK